jgi:3-oxoacid CoA-transferase subunit A
MAMASRITIVEVENDIVPVGDLDPDRVYVPGVYVDRLVRISPDGIWD